EEDRNAAAPGRRLEPAEEVPRRRADLRPGVVLVDVEAELAQVERDAVGDLALLARRARQRGEVGEELDDVRNEQILERGGNCGFGPLAGTLERRSDELAEERRGPRGARLELGVELARDEPRMVRKLDDLDEPAFVHGSGDDEPRLDELRPVVVVHLVAVPVPLVDDRLTVGLAGARPLRDLDRLRAEAHRAAEVLDLL